VTIEQVAGRRKKIMKGERVELVRAEEKRRTESEEGGKRGRTDEVA
jgi:hypothetical protein